MKVQDYLVTDTLNEIPDKTVVGIDIGSRQAKAVLLHGDELFTALIPTGFVMKDTAAELLDRLLRESGLQMEALDYIVATGYGRVALKFEDTPYRIVTEIACHGKGAHFLGKDVQTIIDIGGQDSKAIRIDPVDGKVIDFAMNDKCAAGTGRFLEKISNVLGTSAKEIGKISLASENPTPINSTCVVFAESEVISSRAKGVPVSDLAAGIHESVAKRVGGLINRIRIVPNVLFTGGVSNNAGMRKAFEKLLQTPIVESRLNTVFAGALGAAVFAAEYAEKNAPSVSLQEKAGEFHLDLSEYYRTYQKTMDDYAAKKTGKKAYVAYTCNYTPIEILAAADVAFVRLQHKGTQEEINAGETVTQNMLCDFIKSIMGGFIKENPNFKAIEKVYSFYTCSCMRSAVDAIGRMFVPSQVFNLPRKRKDEQAREYLATEIEAFKEDLEQLTGTAISEAAIREKVREYNLAKRLINEIAEFRKQENPLICSLEFQDLARGYYTIPIQEYNRQLQNILQQLKSAAPLKGVKPRFMLSGGVVTDGDTKINRLVGQLGAEIVVEDNCTGIKPLQFQTEEEGDDVYRNLAFAYLGKAPCARMFPADDMLQYSLKLAEEYHVDGVIFYHLKFCTCYSLTEKLYIDAFRERNIPLLIISGDYAVGDEGQLKTRLEAFIEMVNKERFR